MKTVTGGWNTWRPNASTGQTRSRRNRQLRLIALGVALTVGALGFAYFVSRPFQHARPQILFLSGAGSTEILADPGSSPPRRVTVEREALRRVEWQIARRHDPQNVFSPGPFRGPSDFTRLGDRLSVTPASPGGVLIVSVVATGVVDQQIPYLDWDFGQRPTSRTSRLPVRELLSELLRQSEIPVVVLLDAGEASAIPDRGLIENDFDVRLAELLRLSEFQTPRLWVFCSHSRGETSHLVGDPTRSLFGFFLELGLTGAADFDGNRQIDLRELSQFTSESITRAVFESTRGVATQTPRLLWGGNADQINAAARACVLAPAPARNTNSLGALANLPAASPAPESESDDAAKPAATFADESAAASLLAEAWKIYRELGARTTTGLSPVVRAPHLWRQFHAKLRAMTALHATQGRWSVTDQGDLELFVAPLRPLLDPKLQVPPSSEGEGARLADRLRSSRIAAGDYPSLALHEFFALDSATPLPKEIAEALTRLDGFLAADERGGFHEWLRELPPAFKRFQELDGAEELVALADLDWPLLRKLLEMRRAECQLAIRGLGRRELIAEDLAQARKARRESERLLRDGLRSNRRERAETAVRIARSLVTNAASRLTDHDQASALTRNLWLRTREYINWWWVASSDSPNAGPPFAALDELLTDLHRLRELVERPSPDRAAELRDLTVRLESRRAAVESGVTPEAQQALLANSPGREDAVDGASQIRGLLATSLVDPSAWPPLVAWLAEYNRNRQTQAVHLAAQVASNPSPIAEFASRKRFALLASLESRWARLAEADEPDNESSAANKLLRQLDELALNLRSFPESPETHAAAQRFSKLWHVWAEGLDSRLRENGLRARVPSQSLRLLPRVLSLLPGDNTSANELDTRLARMEQAVWRDWLIAELTALRDAREDASPAELEHLAAYSTKLRTLVSATSVDSIPNIPAGSEGQSESIALVISPELDPINASPDILSYRVKVVNRGTTEQTVHLVIDYDPDVIEFLPEDENLFNDQTKIERLRPEWKRLDRVGREAELLAGLAGSQSLKIAAQSERRLRLVIRRRGARDWPTRVVVKLASTGASHEAPAGDRTLGFAPHTQRAEIDVPLPLSRAFDLTIAAPDRIWNATAGGSVLYPFPNRRDAFQVLLRNTGKPRTFDVRLYTLPHAPEAPPPDGPIDSALADEWLRKLHPGPQLARVTSFKLLADGASRSVPLTGPAPLEDLAETKPAPPGTEKPVGKTGPLPGYAPTPGGLLFVVTDVETGDALLHVCNLMVQRPRRYVIPRVEYSAEEHLISVILKRRPGVAAGRAIDWQCELARSTNDPTPRRVVAQLAAGTSESRLTLAALPGKEPLQLAIAVDGFPRAFLYQISATQTPGEIEEETARLAVRILDPLDGAELPCPLDSVKARVEIDAPPGGMPELGGYWEIGIDRDRDRELEEDLRLRFPTDRRIRTYVSGFTDDGRVVLDARAGDFTVSLPLTGLCNERPQLIAHAVLPDRDSWSSPVELVLDGEGPRIRRVVVGPSQRTIVGPELEITTLATDGEQTGVARVEVAFDVAGTGEFVKEPPPVAAARDEDGRWKASLPTAELKPGQYFVLLRAIDRVGNAGPISRQPLLLETQADLDRDRAAQRTILRGRVEYFGTPVPEVDVVLIPVPETAMGAAGAGDPPKGGATAGKAGAAKEGDRGPGPDKNSLSVKTDAEGKFVIRQVPFGKYTLKANGVFRNKRRETSREIIVDETSNGQAGLLELP